MKKLTRVLAVIFIVLLTACGGGSGGGTSLSYDGLTTPALISDEQTAADLVAEAYFGSDLSDTLPIFSLQGTGTVASAPFPVIRELTGLALEFPSLAVIPESSQIVAAVSSGSEPCYNEGGTVSFSGTETANHINATANFSNCDLGEGFVFNGRFSMEASLDSYGDPTSFSISMNLFSIEWASQNEKILIHGTMSGTSLSNSESISMNLVMSDTLSGQMVMLENYQVSLADMGTYSSLSLSGRVYSSGNGYVDLITIDPILQYYYSDIPHGGVFRVEGAADTWAQYDFEDGSGIFGDGVGQNGTFTLAF